MRIRLLSLVGGRPSGAVFDHDQAEAVALINGGFAEQVEHQDEPTGTPDDEPQAPTPPPKRPRTSRRG